MVPWGALNTFLLPVAIWVFRNGAGYYQSWKTQNTSGSPIKPAGPRVNIVLNALFIIACVTLASTLPHFSPSNIFVETNTRLQTPTDVIHNRLAIRRPLTLLDERTLSRLTSKEARLIYFSFGPNVLDQCPFCTTSDPLSYLYYALPSLLAPYLIYITSIGVLTSFFICGPEPARFRTHATAAALALCAAELWTTLTHDHRANTQSTRTEDIDFFFWRMRLLRSLGMASITGLLGLATWLAATNRMFGSPPSTARRLENAVKGLEQLSFRLLATGNLRNAVARDGELGGRVRGYWARQVRAEGDVYEEREVVEGARAALVRMDREGLGVDERARAQAEAVMGLIQQLP